ncbi:MAG: molybdenum cofactor cytidylyltransferase [Anaerolineae bacterium]
MHLSKALNVEKGDVITLVGAGGKTTAMYRLAQELAGAGWRVVTTTTTLIRPPTPAQSEHVILNPDPAALLRQLQGALEKHHCVTVATGRIADEKGKLRGLPPDLVARVAALPGVDAVIVEGDGARGRSLKVPAPHEPVVPRATTILVPLAAADALGQPLSQETVHRPERVAALARIAPGDEITPQVVAAVLAHPQGGLKGAPPGARVVPLLNKVEGGEALAPWNKDNSTGLAGAREAARLLLDTPAIERVLLAAVAGDDPVQEVWGRVAAVVLAAGASQRFGQPKQLLPWGEKTMLEHVVDVLLASPVHEVIVVLGAQAEAVGAALGERPVRIVVNERWDGGLSTSVRAGLGEVGPNAMAALFVLADQPGLTPDLVERLVERHRRTLGPIVAPVYKGRRGNPVLFDRALFPELAALQGDVGGRALIEKYPQRVERVEVESEAILLDVDTPEDYA